MDGPMYVKYLARVGADRRELEVSIAITPEAIDDMLVDPLLAKYIKDKMIAARDAKAPGVTIHEESWWYGGFLSNDVMRDRVPVKLDW